MHHSDMSSQLLLLYHYLFLVSKVLISIIQSAKSLDSLITLCSRVLEIILNIIIGYELRSFSGSKNIQILPAKRFESKSNCFLLTWTEIVYNYEILYYHYIMKYIHTHGDSIRFFVQKFFLSYNIILSLYHMTYIMCNVYCTYTYTI